MALVETIFSFIILVGILVFVHELGHFLTARWFGMRADVFAVGMGPRLVGWNRKTGFSFGKLPENLDLQGGTDYRLAAFPVGGYVKIAGMVDESMDTEYAAHPPQPWEFRSKGTLAKTVVISAGVIMNILLAIGIYSGLKFFLGTDYQATTVVGVLKPTNPVYKFGLREGDRITSLNGQPVRYFNDVTEGIRTLSSVDSVRIEAVRGTENVTIRFAAAALNDTNYANNQLSPPNTAALVQSVESDGPADAAGLEKNDVILSADGVPITGDHDLIPYIQSHAGQSIRFLILRDGQRFTKDITPNKDKRIGIIPGQEPAYLGAKYHQSFGLFESLRIGFNQTWRTVTSVFGLIGKLVSGEAKFKESVGGPLMIAALSRTVAHNGIDKFLEMMAMLSVTLACMNILPIPALDGGHLVFIFAEGIMRREVPLKVRMAIQQVGFALLLIFMMFVLYNDVARMLK